MIKSNKITISYKVHYFPCLDLLTKNKFLPTSNVSEISVEFVVTSRLQEAAVVSTMAVCGQCSQWREVGKVGEIWGV